LTIASLRNSRGRRGLDGRRENERNAVTDRPQSLVARLRSRLFHLYFLLTRPMTLGVRAAVFDAQGRVFLVRHTYVPGWHFPGGGVESGETALDALMRELHEEGHIVLAGEPKLHGLYFNGAISRRDHVAFYVVRRFQQTSPRFSDREIAETGFFAREALPTGTTRATRARLAEVLDGAAPTQHW
jgi:8-oxo-dGTP pyrophosphatase MutT (NUDIX family)